MEYDPPMEGEVAKFDETPGLDEVLLRLIKERDEKALAALYDLRSSLVYSVALSIVEDGRAADGVTQMVFLRVWDAARVFDRSWGSGLAWLTTLARRLAIEHIRSRPRNLPVREEVPEETANGRTDLEPERHIAGALDADEMMAALKKLDLPHQEVIRLSYFDGLSQQEIAEVLDASPETVESRLSAAVTELRRILDVNV